MKKIVRIECNKYSLSWTVRYEDGSVKVYGLVTLPKEIIKDIDNGKYRKITPFSDKNIYLLLPIE